MSGGRLELPIPCKLDKSIRSLFPKHESLTDEEFQIIYFKSHTKLDHPPKIELWTLYYFGYQEVTIFFKFYIFKNILFI